MLTALAVEDEAVAWRVVAMRPQVPDRGPIPFLMARRPTVSPEGCASCGDPLPRGWALRCVACTQAAWLVLHEVREGVRA